MVQVTDKGASESLVVTVKIEARLEVGSKANGTCLKAYVSKIHILVHVI